MNFLLVGSLRHRIKAAALIFVVAVLAGLLPSCNNSEYHRPPPKVVDGVIDLRHWDFEKSGPVKLDGAWRFRWHRFFRPGASDDNGGGASENHGFITVPGPWNATVRRLTGEDNQLPETGFATYGLTILLPPEDRILALRTEAIFASGEIFINGRLIFSQGNPGTSREDSVGRIRPGVAGFHSGGGKTELRVNASNFHWRIGGIIDPIHIGLPHQIQTIRDRNLNFEVFSFGILLFMSLYHLLLFAIRPSDKSPLFFALFCLEVCLRVVVKGERLVLHVFPSLDDHFFGAAEYLTLPMGVFFFGLFLRSVFPEDMFRRIWYLLMGISALLCVHAVSGDVLTISNHLIYYQTVLILGGVYTMACILRAVSAKRQGAMVFFCGFLIFFVSVINDILVVRGMLPTPEVGHYGWLVFIFFQSGLLAIRFSQAFKTVEDLSVDLENKVRTRTRDLEIAKDKALSAMEAAEKANQAKSTFLANMSHELRTPLNAVIGFSNLTARDRTLSREQRENLATIIRSGELLLALINDVLEFSKIESGRYALKKDRFDLHHLLRGLEEMFMLRAGQKGLHLEFNPDPGLPRFIAADQNKLRQVLINLLGNAVKFTEKGQISISVSGGVSSDPRNDGRYRLVFDISDTGIGIAEADRQKIFDAFYQAAGQRGSRQGTGLGLPISQQFVRMMGGGIRVESTPDKGARFSFDILVDLAVEDVGQTSSVLPRVIGLKPGGPDIRLLVADDDENNRNLLSRLLEMVGFRVAVVHNGLEALEACKADPPHLVFMDIRMPVMDGYEAIRQLSALENGDRPVIIALTASAFEEDRIRVLRKGADDFMRKPFNETELLAKIAEHLDISYIYEEEDASPPVQEAPSERSVASLPPELKAAFREAAVQADYDRAVALVEDIRQEDDALAGYLLPLIDQYQFDKLEALFTDSPTSGD